MMYLNRTNDEFKIETNNDCVLHHILRDYYFVSYTS